MSVVFNGTRGGIALASVEDILLRIPVAVTVILVFALLDYFGLGVGHLVIEYLNPFHGV